ncbi:MAG: HAMP domain-containing protein [Anaerolineaceae bacterium]|nr:HAMP domain-containing protein [Anaerolineaceae bacterium]
MKMGRHVLLIQSEHEAAQTLARFFTEHGDEVWIAWDLGQASALLQQVAPDLLLLDLHFPGDDWLSFLRFARSTFPSIQIILTNKYPDLPREIIARQNGLNTFLRQPFTKRWLARALASLETGANSSQWTLSPWRVRIPAGVKVSLPVFILALIAALWLAALVTNIYSNSPRPLWLDGITPVTVFAVSAGLILLLMALGVYTARRIANPFQPLVHAFMQVGMGNLDVKAETKGDAEAVFLAHAFNRMVVGLQEDSLYSDLLGRVVSAEVHEQLQRTFDKNNFRLEGQEAAATILVSDIRNFTVLSEGADPVRVFEGLNEYFSLLLPIVASFGGAVHKIDSDTLLASFGVLPAPLPPQESAQMACQAALEMNAVIEDLNLQRSRRGDMPLHTGIGLNTGLVIAGGLGPQGRLHYTLIGETVNIAQRLESTTRDLSSGSGVFITQAVFNALGEHTTGFRLDPQGLRALKGKAERVMVYRLLPAKALPFIQAML